MPLPSPVSLDLGEGRKVTIRPAESKDARGWLDLLQAVAAEGRFIALENVSMSRRDLVRYFKAAAWSPQSSALVAADGRRVVGQLTIWRDRGIHAHVAELGMSVASGMRGMGVGRALMRGAFDWAKDFEIEKVQLNVLPHNERAIRFYEQMGFEREGYRKKQAKLSYGYEDFIEMCKFVS